MTTAASDPQIIPRQPAGTLALRAADRGVADALESVLSENTRRVYGAQWRLFNDWCGDVDLPSLPAEPLTVARYLAVRAGSGASIATLRLATSAIAKAHELALVAVLSDGGLRRSEAAALTWGDVVRWDDGSGRITVIRSKTDAEAQGATVAITPAAMRALDAIRPAVVTSGEKVFGLSESQTARRVKVTAKAAGLADWEFFNGHRGQVGMARRYSRGKTAGSALRYL